VILPEKQTCWILKKFYFAKSKKSFPKKCKVLIVKKTPIEDQNHALLELWFYMQQNKLMG